MHSSAFRSALSSLVLLAATTMISPASELVQLVADLDTTLRDDEFSANIGGEMDGLLYFTKETYSYGSEIWKTDGTALGTRLFVELETGTDYQWIETTVAVGNHVYLTGSLGPGQIRKTWRTDGSVVGTTQVPLHIEGAEYTLAATP